MARMLTCKRMLQSALDKGRPELVHRIHHGRYVARALAVRQTGAVHRTVCALYNQTSCAHAAQQRLLIGTCNLTAAMLYCQALVGAIAADCCRSTSRSSDDETARVIAHSAR